VQHYEYYCIKYTPEIKHKGQERKKWLTDSLAEQKTHVKGHTQPFRHKLSVVKILFWTTNQKKQRTLRGSFNSHKQFIE
jgi:hypothetical protein